MIKKHLNYLKTIGDTEPGYIGNNSLKWAKVVVEKKTDIDILLDVRFDRYSLFDYCARQENNNFNVLLAILSWGGMRRDHGKEFFHNYTVVIPIIEKLRSGKYASRKDAFDAFQQLRSNNSLPGLGISYFTKLICFLAPELNGYIMDRWVSKSINLLTGERLVNLSTSGWVNDKNTSETYEQLCSHIDRMAVMLNCKGIEAEKKIFSVGRGKGKWRNYLIANYSSTTFPST